MSRRHGTNAKYVIDKCRCNACRRAARDVGNHRNRQIAYGRWQPYIDAEPVRQHVRDLMGYGIGFLRVADQAGVSRSTVGKLLYGDPQRGQAPSKRVRPETAAKLLAVHAQPQHLGATTGVDPTGTRRRLQALVAAGWPMSRLAAELGIHRSNFGKTLTAPKVRASTERATRAIYDRLWNTDPRDHGVSLHSYNRARRHAADHQWAPIGAWDDDQIDDPLSHPDWTGQCGTAAGYKTHYRIGIRACRPCLDAISAEQRARRAAA